MCCFVSSALKNTLPTELLRAPNGSWKHMVRHVSHMTREDRGRCSGEWTSPRWFVLIPFDSHSWPFHKPLNVFAYATLRTTRMASSTLTQFPSSEFEFSTSLRPQRPYGLRRTGTPGPRPDRLSHSSPALNSSSALLYVRRDRTDYEGRGPQDWVSSTLTQFPSSEFEFSTSLRPQRPYGLRRTGTPGPRPARLSHSSPALNSSSVLLYVRRDRTAYEGRGPQDLGQLDSHTVPQLWIRIQYCSTSTETVRTTKDGDHRTGSARLSHSSPALKSSSVLLYVHRDRTDYEGRGPQDWVSSTLTQFPSSEFEFSTSLRPQRPYGLRRTGTPGPRPARLSHCSWAL